MDFELSRKLLAPSETTIVLIVLDGLGGLPSETHRETELEAANTPNLDELASSGTCGLHEAVGSGITPGSGPGHLALFGYDPIRYQVGRGVLAALGIDFDLRSEDVAARGNFCTVDENGRVTDRRAGRISTERNEELCELLRKIDLGAAELFIQTVKEHRFLLVLRGEDLHADILDTDPQQTGRKPLEAEAREDKAERAAGLVRSFADRAQAILGDRHPANMVLLRGFSRKPQWPRFSDVFGLRAAAIAGYPMYRGLAKLIGMDIVETSADLDRQMDVLEEQWGGHDFFFVHVKATDSAGEDGDFGRKVSAIEEFDKRVPRLRSLHPDVLVVTGDHSTPAALKNHSWHPVPVLLWSKTCRPDRVEQFGERPCVGGGLGARFPASDLIPLAMAHALRYGKFGA
jgi:2,3-bisphosphoglycerate-independent phosphoglycerate mutase